MTHKERPIIVFFSGTGMTERLVKKINIDESFDVLRIKTGKEVINRKYILITPTYMQGEIPKQVQRFIAVNNPPQEVIGTGNRQWGLDFCGAGIKIAERFNIPLIAKVEQAGHFNEINSILSYFKKQYQVKVAS